ncbi:hypothetical protein EHM69_08050 [candidate division KSB1 bacterium]|nr:MAG: hypothetical protein EHM69_08050 [candidate division KSB1 bacterium]
MAVHWTPELSTGLDWQDEQHQQIIGKIDELLESMNRNEARNVIASLFEFLESYTVQHFAAEESYLQRKRCTGFAPHRAQHLEFIARMREMERVFNKQGASTYVVMQVQRWLRDWVLDHISQVDKRMAVSAAECKMPIM